MSQAAQPSLFEERTDALSINALYNRVEGALARTFPRNEQLWVRGEIQSLSDRTGHCYFDMVDPEADNRRDAPVLKVRCWRSTWRLIAADLARQGARLEPGLVVAVRGRPELYRPRAELGFILEAVDVAALVGRLALQKQALIRNLEQEGLIGRNGALLVVSPPLRIGLVGSPETEGYRDFVAQLESSGFAFEIKVVRTQVQGMEAPRLIAGALKALAAPSARPDVVVLVRGGGSKSDLGAFDAEHVARAIADMPVPVWTGVGHTGDESVADLCANRSLPTPTACGRELVGLVRAWWDAILERAVRVADQSRHLAFSAESHDDQMRSRMAAAARAQLRGHSRRMQHASERIGKSAVRAGNVATQQLDDRSRTVCQLAPLRLLREDERLDSWRRLLSAYDPEHQLRRGWTLTLDEAGQVVRSAATLSVGSRIMTRFADGETTSTVDLVRGAPGNGTPSSEGADEE